MKKCEVCGNEYEDLFEVKFKNDEPSYWFDCFECAIHRLAPECSLCGVKILGHGVEANSLIFCSAHCARSLGYKEIVDHATGVAAI